MSVGDGLVAKLGKGTTHTKDEILAAIKEQKVFGLFHPGNNLTKLIFKLGESRIGLGIDKPPYDPSSGIGEDEYSRANYSLHFVNQDGGYALYTSGIIVPRPVWD